MGSILGVLISLRCLFWNHPSSQAKTKESIDCLQTLTEGCPFQCLVCTVLKQDFEYSLLFHPILCCWRFQREGFLRGAVAYILSMHINRFFVRETPFQSFNFPTGFAHFQFTCYSTYPLTVHILLHIFTYTSHVTSHIQVHFTCYHTYPRCTSPIT